jgi:GntR family transcriptional regulator
MPDRKAGGSLPSAVAHAHPARANPAGSSPTPPATGDLPRLKHAEIAEVLKNEIRTGRVRFGRKLPGEKALASRFSVSRNTIRAALSELSRAGMIATRSGKGSFVTFDGRPLDGELGWARALKAHGVQSEIHVLRIERMTSGSIAQADQGTDEFIAIDRVRRIVDGPAVSYERSRVPAIPALLDLPTRGLVDGSITQTLIAAGLLVHSAEQWIGARPLMPAEAEVLGRRAGELFLYATRVTRTRSNGLVERVEALLDPEHFELRFRQGHR